MSCYHCSSKSKFAYYPCLHHIFPLNNPESPTVFPHLNSKKMQYFQIFTLLPFITAALAAPLDSANSNTTIHVLQKRANYPWIGFYDAKNTNCQGDPIQVAGNDRPKLYQGTQQSNTAYACTAWTRPAGSMVKIFWGTGNYQVNEVSAFYKPGCPDDGYAKVFRSKNGPGTSECFDVRDNAQAWTSVRAGWH